MVCHEEFGAVRLVSFVEVRFDGETSLWNADTIWELGPTFPAWALAKWSFISYKFRAPPSCAMLPSGILDDSTDHFAKLDDKPEEAIGAKFSNRNRSMACHGMICFFFPWHAAKAAEPCANCPSSQRFWRSILQYTDLSENKISVFLELGQ